MRMRMRGMKDAGVLNFALPLGVIVRHQAAAGLGELMDRLGVVLHRLLKDLVFLQHGHGALLILTEKQNISEQFIILSE